MPSSASLFLWLSNCNETDSGLDSSKKRSDKLSLFSFLRELFGDLVEGTTARAHGWEGPGAPGETMATMIGYHDKGPGAWAEVRQQRTHTPTFSFPINCFNETTMGVDLTRQTRDDRKTNHLNN